MGFQSNVDGDFVNYKESYDNFVFGGHVLEKGEYFWLYLNYYCCQIMSWSVFVCLLSAFECWSVYRFVDEFAEGKYKYISAILFFFTFNYMLIQMKAMRQGLSVEFALFAFLFLQKNKTSMKDLIMAVLFSVAAYYTHHTSSIIVLLVWLGYFFNSSNYVSKVYGNSKWFPFVMASLALILFQLKPLFINSYVFPILTIWGGTQYESYAQELIDNSNVTTGLVVFYEVAVIFLLSWYLKFASNKQKYITIVAIIGMFVDIICFGNASVQRLLLYFSIFNLAVYPCMISKVERHFGKPWALAVVVLLIGYAMKTSVFWLMSGDKTMFGQYRFIFQ
jgi:hypothetical protein